MTTQNLKWNDPALWAGVSTGTCANCKKSPHVLRHGLCFTCESTLHQVPTGYSSKRHQRCRGGYTVPVGSTHYSCYGMRGQLLGERVTYTDAIALVSEEGGK